MPTVRLRYRASSSRLISDRLRPCAKMVPEVGRSRPAIRFKSVDFPEPELPSSARNSPAQTSSVTSSRHYQMGSALIRAVDAAETATPSLAGIIAPRWYYASSAVRVTACHGADVVRLKSVLPPKWKAAGEKTRE